uniref:Uncharacterized protein n=2 Tax=Opuntia streptacantha TaxID=393608 RepID=A0A7C9E440_OPUST
MDLLCKAYDSNDSDDDQQSKPQPEHDLRPEPAYGFTVGPPPKRAKPYYPLAYPEPDLAYRPPIKAPNPQSGAPAVSGRYISKREKALMGSGSVTPGHPDPPPSIPSSPVIGSISSANVRHDIVVSLRQQANLQPDKKKLPNKTSIALNGHVKSVNALQWSKSHVFSVQCIF